MIFGTFDHLHEGHRFLVTQAKARGAVVAVVGTDPTVHTIKGRPALQSLRERVAALAHAFPDITVIPGSPKDFLEPIHAQKPDLLLFGYDQKLPPGISFDQLSCHWERAGALQPHVYKSSILSRKKRRDIEEKDKK